MFSLWLRNNFMILTRVLSTYQWLTLHFSTSSYRNLVLTIMSAEPTLSQGRNLPNQVSTTTQFCYNNVLVNDRISRLNLLLSPTWCSCFQIFNVEKLTCDVSFASNIFRSAVSFYVSAWLTLLYLRDADRFNCFYYMSYATHTYIDCFHLLWSCNLKMLRWFRNYTMASCANKYENGHKLTSNMLMFLSDSLSGCNRSVYSKSCTNIDIAFLQNALDIHTNKYVG